MYKLLVILCVIKFYACNAVFKQITFLTNQGKQHAKNWLESRKNYLCSREIEEKYKLKTTTAKRHFVIILWFVNLT